MDEVKRQATIGLKNNVARHIAEIVTETLEDLGATLEEISINTTEGRNWIRLRLKSDMKTGPGRRYVREFLFTITETKAIQP